MLGKAKTANYDTECEDCYRFIGDGEEIYFHGGERRCKPCAKALGIVCSCGGQKQSQYELCYVCSKEPRGVKLL